MADESKSGESDPAPARTRAQTRGARVEAGVCTEREQQLVLEALQKSFGKSEHAEPNFAGWTTQRKGGKEQQRILAIGAFGVASFAKHSHAFSSSSLSMSKCFSFEQLSELSSMLDGADHIFTLTFKAKKPVVMIFASSKTAEICRCIVSLAREARSSAGGSFPELSLDLAPEHQPSDGAGATAVPSARRAFFAALQQVVGAHNGDADGTDIPAETMEHLQRCFAGEQVGGPAAHACAAPDGTLHEAACALPGGTVLDLQRVFASVPEGVSDAQLVALGTALQASSHFKALVMHNMSLSTAATEALLNARSLTSLTMRGCNVAEPSLALLQAWPSPLVHLDLSHNQMGGSIATALAAVLALDQCRSTLRFLRLARCGLSAADSASVFRALHSCQLVALDMSENALASSDVVSWLEQARDCCELHMNSTGIDVGLVAKAVGANESLANKLVYLNVGGNACTDLAPAVSLAELALRWARMDNMSLTNQTLTAMLEVWQTRGTGAPTNVQTILDTGFSMLVQGNDFSSKQNRPWLMLPACSITELDVSDSHLGASGLGEVVDAAAQCDTLRVFRASRNVRLKTSRFAKTDPSELQALVQKFVAWLGSGDGSAQLEELVLRGGSKWHAFGQHMIPLIDALRGHTALTRLDVGFNCMGDDCAGALSRCLVENESLTDISMDGNKIQAGGFRELAAALQDNSAIVKLEYPTADATNAADTDAVEVVLEELNELVARNQAAAGLPQIGMHMSAMTQGFDNDDDDGHEQEANTPGTKTDRKTSVMGWLGRKARGVKAADDSAKPTKPTKRTSLLTGAKKRASMLAEAARGMTQRKSETASGATTPQGDAGAAVDADATSTKKKAAQRKSMSFANASSKRNSRWDQLQAEKATSPRASGDATPVVLPDHEFAQEEQEEQEAAQDERMQQTDKEGKRKEPSQEQEHSDAVGAEDAADESDSDSSGDEHATNGSESEPEVASSEEDEDIKPRPRGKGTLSDLAAESDPAMKKLRSWCFLQRSSSKSNTSRTLAYLVPNGRLLRYYSDSDQNNLLGLIDLRSVIEIGTTKKGDDVRRGVEGLPYFVKVGQFVSEGLHDVLKLKLGGKAKWKVRVDPKKEVEKEHDTKTTRKCTVTLRVPQGQGVDLQERIHTMIRIASAKGAEAPSDRNGISKIASVFGKVFKLNKAGKWKPRYFFICPEVGACVYCKDVKGKDIRGCIDLASISVAGPTVEKPPPPDTRGFFVRTHEKTRWERTYFLASAVGGLEQGHAADGGDDEDGDDDDTDGQMHEWVKAMVQAAKRAQDILSVSVRARYAIAPAKGGKHRSLGAPYQLQLVDVPKVLSRETEDREANHDVRDQDIERRYRAAKTVSQQTYENIMGILNEQEQVEEETRKEAAKTVASPAAAKEGMLWKRGKRSDSDFKERFFRLDETGKLEYWKTKQDCTASKRPKGTIVAASVLKVEKGKREPPKGPSFSIVDDEAGGGIIIHTDTRMYQLRLVGPKKSGANLVERDAWIEALQATSGGGSAGSVCRGMCSWCFGRTTSATSGEPDTFETTRFFRARLDVPGEETCKIVKCREKLYEGLTRVQLEHKDIMQDSLDRFNAIRNESMPSLTQEYGSWEAKFLALVKPDAVVDPFHRTQYTCESCRHTVVKCAMQNVAKWEGKCNGFARVDSFTAFPLCAACVRIKFPFNKKGEIDTAKMPDFKTIRAVAQGIAKVPWSVGIGRPPPPVGSFSKAKTLDLWQASWAICAQDRFPVGRCPWCFNVCAQEESLTLGLDGLKAVKRGFFKKKAITSEDAKSRADKGEDVPERVVYTCTKCKKPTTKCHYQKGEPPKKSGKPHTEVESRDKGGAAGGHCGAFARLGEHVCLLCQARSASFKIDAEAKRHTDGPCVASINPHFTVGSFFKKKSAPQGFVCWEDMRAQDKDSLSSFPQETKARLAQDGLDALEAKASDTELENMLHKMMLFGSPAHCVSAEGNLKEWATDLVSDSGVVAEGGDMLLSEKAKRAASVQRWCSYCCRFGTFTPCSAEPFDDGRNLTFANLDSSWRQSFRVAFSCDQCNAKVHACKLSHGMSSGKGCFTGMARWQDKYCAACQGTRYQKNRKGIHARLQFWFGRRRQLQKVLDREPCKTSEKELYFVNDLYSTQGSEFVLGDQFIALTSSDRADCMQKGMKEWDRLAFKTGQDPVAIEELKAKVADGKATPATDDDNWDRPKPRDVYLAALNAMNGKSTDEPSPWDKKKGLFARIKSGRNSLLGSQKSGEIVLGAIEESKGSEGTGEEEGEGEQGGEEGQEDDGEGEGEGEEGEGEEGGDEGDGGGGEDDGDDDADSEDEADEEVSTWATNEAIRKEAFSRGLIRPFIALLDMTHEDRLKVSAALGIALLALPCWGDPYREAKAILWGQRYRSVQQRVSNKSEKKNGGEGTLLGPLPNWYEAVYRTTQAALGVVQGVPQEQRYNGLTNTGTANKPTLFAHSIHTALDPRGSAEGAVEETRLMQKLENQFLTGTAAIAAFPWGALDRGPTYGLRTLRQMFITQAFSAVLAQKGRKYMGLDPADETFKCSPDNIALAAFMQLGAHENMTPAHFKQGLGITRADQKRNALLMASEAASLKKAGGQTAAHAAMVAKAAKVGLSLSLPGVAMHAGKAVAKKGAKEAKKMYTTDIARTDWRKEKGMTTHAAFGAVKKIVERITAMAQSGSAVERFYQSVRLHCTNCEKMKLKWKVHGEPRLHWGFDSPYDDVEGGSRWMFTKLRARESAASKWGYHKVTLKEGQVELRSSEFAHAPGQVFHMQPDWLVDGSDLNGLQIGGSASEGGGAHEGDTWGDANESAVAVEEQEDGVLQEVEAWPVEQKEAFAATDENFAPEMKEITGSDMNAMKEKVLNRVGGGAAKPTCYVMCLCCGYSSPLGDAGAQDASSLAERARFGDRDDLPHNEMQLKALAKNDDVPKKQIVPRTLRLHTVHVEHCWDKARMDASYRESNVTPKGFFSRMLGSANSGLAKRADYTPFLRYMRDKAQMQKHVAAYKEKHPDVKVPPTDEIVSLMRTAWTNLGAAEKAAYDTFRKGDRVVFENDQDSGEAKTVKGGKEFLAGSIAKNNNDGTFDIHLTGKFGGSLFSKGVTMPSVQQSMIRPFTPAHAGYVLIRQPREGYIRNPYRQPMRRAVCFVPVSPLDASRFATAANQHLTLLQAYQKKSAAGSAQRAIANIEVTNAEKRSDGQTVTLGVKLENSNFPDDPARFDYFLRKKPFEIKELCKTMGTHFKFLKGNISDAQKDTETMWPKLLGEDACAFSSEFNAFIDKRMQLTEQEHSVTCVFALKGVPHSEMADEDSDVRASFLRALEAFAGLSGDDDHERVDILLVKGAADGAAYRVHAKLWLSTATRAARVCSKMRKATDDASELQSSWASEHSKNSSTALGDDLQLVVKRAFEHDSIELLTQELRPDDVYYIMRVRIGALEWSVAKGYREFLAMDKLLKTHYAGTISLRLLPPPKRAGAARAPGAIDLRMQAVRNYLDDIMVQPDVRSAPEFMAFVSPPARSLEKHLGSDRAAKTVPRKARKQDLKEGVMSKRGQLVKSWKERFFVLLPAERKLQYYAAAAPAEVGDLAVDAGDSSSIAMHIKNKKDADQEQPALLKGQISLRNVKVSPAPADGHPWAFQLDDHDRTWLLEPQTEEERDSWIQAISACVPQRDTKQGTFDKYSSNLKTWSERLFVIDPITRKVRCFKENKCVAEMKFSDLVITELVPKMKFPESDHVFRLATGRTEWVLRGKDRQDVLDFVNCVRSWYGRREITSFGESTSVGLLGSTIEEDEEETKGSS